MGPQIYLHNVNDPKHSNSALSPLPASFNHETDWNYETERDDKLPELGDVWSIFCPIVHKHLGQFL